MMQMGYFNDLDQLGHYHQNLENSPLIGWTGNLSDFKPYKNRDNPHNLLPELKQYRLEVSEEDRNKFLEAYSLGSEDAIISDSNFDYTYYFELFMFMNLDNTLDNKTGESDNNKGLFFEWVYENRDSFDIKRIPNDIFAYLDKKGSDTWGQKIEIMDLEMIYTYVSGINSLFDTLGELDKLIRSEDRSPSYLSINYIANSIKEYMRQDTNTIINETTMFNLLRQKHLNEHSASILKELIRFSTHINSEEIYKPEAISLIELLSKSNDEGTLNGQFGPHKLKLKKIYEQFGGEENIFSN